MQNITKKSNSLRKAVAQATVTVGSEATIEAVRNGTVPKGNVLEVSRTAGLFAVKRTSDMVPDCHPLPIEFCEIRFAIEATSILIELEVATIYKTGVEVEAMHGASIVALTIYDMLKPIDDQIEIHKIRLLTKSGGKKSFKRNPENLRAAVLVISDSVSSSSAEDRSGTAIRKEFERYLSGPVEFRVVADEVEAIRSAISEFSASGVKFLLTTGGTGISLRDVTPEAVAPLITLGLPGVSEALRSYGQQRTPYAMLSRSVAGLIGEMFVATLPGSPTGVADGLQVLFPYVFHLMEVRSGGKH